MSRVLLLGPERQRAAGLRGLLARDGHRVTWLRSLDHWLTREREIQPEIVVASVARADNVLNALDRPASGFPAPLLLVQQEGDFVRERHVPGRLVDRLASPFMSGELLARVDGLIRVRRVIGRHVPRPSQSPSRRQEGMGRRLSSWFKARLRKSDKPAGPYLEVAARVAEWSDLRDAFEPGHASRVASFCAMIAEGLSLDEQETAELLRAAMLHDVGKVALPVEVLHQRRPLEDEQRQLIRTHPARGAALLRALDPDERVARIVLYHHERPDGNGYYGKQAQSVPQGAKALAVAEAYDAMTTNLLGRAVKSDEALDILLSRRGEAFDADCVEALIDALRPPPRAIPLSRV